MLWGFWFEELEIMHDILEQPGAGTTWPVEDTRSAAFAHIWKTSKVGSPVTFEAVSININGQSFVTRWTVTCTYVLTGMMKGWSTGPQHGL